MTDVRAEDAEFEGSAAPNAERRTLQPIHGYADQLETTEQWQHYHEATVAEWARRFDERGQQLIEARARIAELESSVNDASGEIERLHAKVDRLIGRHAR